jgi:hypothetical protein
MQDRTLSAELGGLLAAALEALAIPTPATVGDKKRDRIATASCTPGWPWRRPTGQRPWLAADYLRPVSPSALLWVPPPGAPRERRQADERAAHCHGADLDHGPVTLTCPAWCSGPYGAPGRVQGRPRPRWC